MIFNQANEFLDWEIDDEFFFLIFSLKFWIVLSIKVKSIHLNGLQTLCLDFTTRTCQK